MLDDGLTVVPEQHLVEDHVQLAIGWANSGVLLGAVARTGPYGEVLVEVAVDILVEHTFAFYVRLQLEEHIVVKITQSDLVLFFSLEEAPVELAQRDLRPPLPVAVATLLLPQLCHQFASDTVALLDQVAHRPFHRILVAAGTVKRLFPDAQ